MSSFHDTLAFVMTHEHKERITVGAQRKMRFLPGWGDLGRSPGACVGRALWAKAEGWWQHPTPRDWVGLGGLGVPFPRAPSAKQRSLDPSPLELGTQGPCWSMARGQSPGRRWRRLSRSPEPPYRGLLHAHYGPSHGAAGMKLRLLPQAS